MTDLQVYPFAMAANGVHVLQAVGSRFVIVSSTGRLTVRLDTGGTLSNIQAGQGIGQRPFSSLTLTDVSGYANSGYIVVSDDDFIDNRVTGEVSIFDALKLQSLAGVNYFSVASQAAVAAKYSAVQLWNPLGSGKSLMIDRFEGYSGLAGTPMYLYRSQAALANAAPVQGNSKRLGSSVVAKGLIKREDVAALPLAADTLFQVSGPASGTGLIQNFKGPIVVPPGWGVTAQCATQNISILANWEWSEEAYDGL